jgi:hypothetical protein
METGLIPRDFSEVCTSCAEPQPTVVRQTTPPSSSLTKDLLLCNENSVQVGHKGISLPMAAYHATEEPLNSQTQFEREAGLLEDLAHAHESVNLVADTISEVHTMISKLKLALSYESMDDFGKTIFKRLDQLLILILDLRTRSSLADMIFPIMQYLGTLSNTSLSHKFSTWIMRIAITDSTGHAEETRWEPIGDQTEFDLKTESGGWFECNWKTLTEGKFGSKLSGIINLLILAGLMPEKAQHEVTEEVFKILQVHNMRKKTPSIFHHLFSTLDWLVDSVVPALTTGNFALLFSDADEVEIDQMYVQALDMANMNVTGQMERIKEKYGISDESELLVFIMNVTGAHMAVKQKCANDKPYQREITHRLIKLDKVCADIQAFWHASGMRIKPYAVLFRGGSSVGKSTLAGIAHHAICMANDLPSEKEYCCTINGSDKYQSEYRSQHICVIFDDMGNTRPEKAEGNPLFTLIQFINNMHCSALSPEADKKGKNDIRAKIVLVTTNTTDLHSWHFSCNPTSIMRRFDLIVDVELKEECTSSSGGILPKYAGISHPDIWKLTLSTVNIERKGAHQDKWSLLPVIDKGDIVDFVNYLAEQSPLHFSTQNKLVNNSSELHKREHCPAHPFFTLPCPACSHCKSEESAFIPLGPETGSYSQRSRCLPDPDDFLARFGELTLIYEEEPPPVISVLDGTQNLSFSARIKAIKEAGFVKLSMLSRQFKDIHADPKLKLLAGIAALGLVSLTMHSIFSDKKMSNEGAMLETIRKQAKTPRQIVERDNAYQRVYTNVRNFPKASVSTTIASLETKIDNNLHVAIVKEMNPLTGEIFEANAEWCNTFPLKG